MRDGAKSRIRREREMEREGQKERDAGSLSMRE